MALDTSLPRTMMLYSLRFRLLLTLIGVVAVAVVTGALFASRVTSRELQRYVELDIGRNRRLTDTLITYYARNSADVKPQALAWQIAGETSERIIMTDGGGQVQADTGGVLVGQTIDCQESVSGLIISIGGTRCAVPTAGDAYSVDQSSAGDILFFGVPFGAAMARPAQAISTTQTFGGAVAPPCIASRRPSIIIPRGGGPGPPP